MHETLNRIQEKQKYNAYHKHTFFKTDHDYLYILEAILNERSEKAINRQYEFALFQSICRACAIFSPFGTSAVFSVVRTCASFPVLGVRTVLSLLRIRRANRTFSIM